MNRKDIQVKLSSGSSMKPMIDRYSIHVARILSGKVSREALVSLVELLEESFESQEAEIEEDQYA